MTNVEVSSVLESYVDWVIEQSLYSNYTRVSRSIARNMVYGRS